MGDDTPCSETLERISMNLGIYNYFPDVTTHANPYDAVTSWVVSVNSQFTNVEFLYVSFHRAISTIGRDTKFTVLHSFIHSVRLRISQSGLYRLA